MATKIPLHERRDLAAAITALLRPDDDDEADEIGARAKRDGAILVVYGYGRGDFQTISVEQAREYRDQLASGRTGAPWEVGIR